MPSSPPAAVFRPAEPVAPAAPWRMDALADSANWRKTLTLRFQPAVQAIDEGENR